MGGVCVSQWRCRIGCFSGICHRSQICSTKAREAIVIKHRIHAVSILSMLLIYSNIVQILLVITGVEQNPGPRIGEKEGT